METDMKEKFHLTKADWSKFYGHNHHKIPHPEVYAGGYVNLKSHFGKPLSQDLWEDLVHRFCITGLVIYKYGDGEKLTCGSPCHCIIHLDEQENVDDILIEPYSSSLYPLFGKNKSTTSSETDTHRNGNNQDRPA